MQPEGQSSLPDASVIRLAVEGDPQARNQLLLPWVELLHRVVPKWVRSPLPNWIGPDDIVGEILEAVWRNFETFDPGDDPEKNFRKWVWGITRNRVLQALQEQGMQRDHYDRLAQELTRRLSENGEETPSVQEQREWSERLLHGVIADLPQSDQELIYLYYFDEEALIDVAEFLSKRGKGDSPSVDALKQRLDRIRDRLLLRLGRPSRHRFRGRTSRKNTEICKPKGDADQPRRDEDR